MIIHSRSTDFSIKYDPHKFFDNLIVSLSLVPDLARKYNINTSEMSRQLPTVILFEDGVEKQRFPYYDPDSKKFMKVLKFDKVSQK